MFVYGSNIAIYLTKKKEYVNEIFCFSANHSTSTSACVAGIWWERNRCLLGFEQLSCKLPQTYLEGLSFVIHVPFQRNQLWWEIVPHGLDLWQASQVTHAKRNMKIIFIFFLSSCSSIRSRFPKVTSLVSSGDFPAFKLTALDFNIDCFWF